MNGSVHFRSFFNEILLHLLLRFSIATVDSFGHTIFEAARPIRSHGTVAACAPIHPFVIAVSAFQRTPGVNDIGTDDILQLS
jgi:hypothetical protein